MAYPTIRSSRMNWFPYLYLLLLLLLTSQCAQGYMVDLSQQVACASEADDESTKNSAKNEICRGSFQYIYFPPAEWHDWDSGRNWHYRFVHGLPDGFDYSDYWNWEGREQCTYGPEVLVNLHQDEKACTITVGNEQCKTCKLCELEEITEDPITGESIQQATFSADCTNLQESIGKKVGCAPVLPFFMPLQVLPNPNGDQSTRCPAIKDLKVKPQLNFYFEKGHQDTEPGEEEISNLTEMLTQYIQDLLVKNHPGSAGPGTVSLGNVKTSYVQSKSAKDKHQFDMDVTVTVTLDKESTMTRRAVANMIANTKNFDQYKSAYAPFTNEGKRNGVFFETSLVKLGITG